MSDNVPQDQFDQADDQIEDFENPPVDDQDDGNEYQQFDDWYNDGECEDDDIENQAASIEDAEAEQRTLIDAAQIKNAGVACGGQLICRFQKPGENGFTYKFVSAHLAKQTDGGYIALTTRTNVHSAKANLVDGYFFLQKTSAKEYLARFQFTANDVIHFGQQGYEFNAESDIHTIFNFSAIRLREENMKEHGQLPEVQDLVVNNLDNAADNEALFNISGYPKNIVAGPAQQTAVIHQMYAMTGKIVEREEHVNGIPMLTSSGQEGGALTDVENGQIVGILSGVKESNEAKFGAVLKIKQEIVDWVNQLQF